MCVCLYFSLINDSCFLLRNASYPASRHVSPFTHPETVSTNIFAARDSSKRKIFILHEYIIHVVVSEQALGWFPLGLGLIVEDEPFYSTVYSVMLVI